MAADKRTIKTNNRRVPTDDTTRQSKEQGNQHQHGTTRAQVVPSIVLSFIELVMRSYFPTLSGKPNNIEAPQLNPHVPDAESSSVSVPLGAVSRP